jgi:hypothetical protein
MYFQCAYDIQKNIRSPWGRKNMAFNRCWLHQNQENENTPSCDEISICSCIKSKRKLNEIVRLFLKDKNSSPLPPPLLCLGDALNDVTLLEAEDF